RAVSSSVVQICHGNNSQLRALHYVAGNGDAIRGIEQNARRSPAGWLADAAARRVDINVVNNVVGRDLACRQETKLDAVLGDLGGGADADNRVPGERDVWPRNAVSNPGGNDSILAERAAAEQAKAEADRSKQEADLAARKSEQEKTEAESAKAAALEQQQALQAQNERARSQAEESERGRQKAEQEKAAMRARLLQQLNAILVTRDTARGLIATMPDVLFETNKSSLKPTARESLAKVAGILLSYPDLRLEVDGHTDSVGSDAYNQQLSE